MRSEDRTARPGRVVPAGGVQIYEWPMGPGLRLIVRMLDDDVVTACIEVEEQSQRQPAERDLTPLRRW